MNTTHYGAVGVHVRGQALDRLDRLIVVALRLSGEDRQVDFV